MSEPLFDPTLKKKKKKKTVAFNEDPLGADADPTYENAVPAPTVHEQTREVEPLKSAIVNVDRVEEKEKVDEVDELSLAGFGDLKKKKKKKDIPLDFVRYCLILLFFTDFQTGRGCWLIEANRDARCCCCPPCF